MTTTQLRILECVRKGFTTRKAIAENTGMQKGFSKVMGAITKGKPGKGTLVGDGLLKAAKGDDGWEYELTASGRKLLAQQGKAEVAASLEVRHVERKAGKAKVKAGKGKGKPTAKKASKAKVVAA